MDQLVITAASNGVTACRTCRVTSPNIRFCIADNSLACCREKRLPDRGSEKSGAYSADFPD